jgi:C1A family cysteine protease
MQVRETKYRIGGYRAGQKPAEAKHHSTDRFEKDQLPNKVNLRKYMTAVEEQVGNSCVANALVGAYEYLAKRSIGSAADVSRLFVYYNARAQEGCEAEDGGAQMSCAIDCLIEHGACSEELWPNDEEFLCYEPHAEAYTHAANFKITQSEFIETDLDVWRHTLAEGYPIAFALNTFDSFDDATQNRGRVPQPKKSDNYRETHGWHAMLCVGYSDKDRMFIVRNSWGSEWGEQGYCYIPYDYIIHQDYNAHDSWIIRSLSDLDFSAEVWEGEQSFFYDDESLLISRFYLHTEDPDGFIEALDALCKSFVSEADYYFDYQQEELDDSKVFAVEILNFDLTIADPKDFLAALESTCQNHAVEAAYGFSIDSEEYDEEEFEDEDELEDEEIDEDNEIEEMELEEDDPEDDDAEDDEMDEYIDEDDEDDEDDY